MKPIRVLVIDDESPARRRVKQLLETHSDVEVAGEADSGKKAVHLIQTLEPDLIFLDIQMPGLDGFEVLQQIGEPRPIVVFVTAYDHYALRAFEEHAVDYLLKPYDRQRFEKCLAAARRQVSRERSLDWPEQIRAMLADVAAQRPGPPALTRIPVKTTNRVYWIESEDVLYVQAAGKYVEIHAYGKRRLVRKPLGKLAAALGSNRFLQIHRSYVVNLAQISHLQPWSSSEYLVVLKDGTKLLSGRTYKDQLQALMAL